MRAMLSIHHNERLEKLGWKMVLQIHDEVTERPLILKGPSEPS